MVLIIEIFFYHFIDWRPTSLIVSDRSKWVLVRRLAEFLMVLSLLINLSISQFDFCDYLNKIISK